MPADLVASGRQRMIKYIRVIVSFLSRSQDLSAEPECVSLGDYCAAILVTAMGVFRGMQCTAAGLVQRESKLFQLAFRACLLACTG